MERLRIADRVLAMKTVLRFKRMQSDFAVQAMTDIWEDVSGGAGSDKIYVVQTSKTVIERCLLMTTDPGDLVLDPTCVRKGTKVLVVELTPLNPPATGGKPESGPLPGCGEGRGGVNAATGGSNRFAFVQSKTYSWAIL